MSIDVEQAHASNREQVLLSGILTRSDVLASCVVRATKVTIPSLDLWEYVKADVALGPPQMPNGEYELHFDGRMMKVRNEAGQWFSEDARASHHA